MSQSAKELMDIEEEMTKVENNEDSTLCKACQHRCCENMGCEIYPIDVIKKYGEISVDTIEKLIATGYVSIDWYSGDPRNGMHELEKGYYLRMRNKDAPISDPCFEGECIAYDKKTGCKLSFENRPLGGRILCPKPDMTCDYGSFEGSAHRNGKRMASIHWVPYHDILKSIADKYYDPNYHPTCPDRIFSDLLDAFLGYRDITFQEFGLF